jgi:hypothetical protein
LEFESLKNLRVEARFDEPQVTSDFGAVLLRELENRLNLSSKLADCIHDERNQSYVEHSLSDLICQRILQICQGYEDADDCDHLRLDPAFQTAVGKAPGPDTALASQPTMTRLENRVRPKELFRLGHALGDIFLDSFDTAPQAIVIDMDPTAVHCHGAQQLLLFNAHEDEYCLMPFHVYDGLTGKLITATIRPGKTPRAGEILALLKRIVRKIRARFPETVLIFRADSHHSKPEVHAWCEANGVEFVTGLSPNRALNRQFEYAFEQARLKYKKIGRACRIYASGYYAAATWARPRRVICRINVNDSGELDARYIVTSFEDTGAKYLYEEVYCDRGNAELFIKDHKNGLKSDRASCHKATANQFRLFLHSAAYMLMHALREKLLAGTHLANAQFDTIRLRLLKCAARVEVSTRRIFFHLPQHFPCKDICRRICDFFAALRI